jgi:hypothetical protein
MAEGWQYWYYSNAPPRPLMALSGHSRRCNILSAIGQERTLTISTPDRISEGPPRGGLSDSSATGKVCSNAPLIKVEAVTADERHKNRGRKDGDKITGDGNRLFGSDHIVPGCAAWLECDGNPYK